MSFQTDRRPSTRHLFCLSVIISLPFLALILLYAFSLGSLAKYAVVGAAAAVLSLVLLSYPKFGILLSVFYVYSGISFYFSQHLSYPVIAVVFFAACLELLSGREARLRDPLYNWSVVFFTIFAIQSMLFSYSFSNSIVSFSFYLRVLILTFLFVQFLRTARDLESYVVAVFLGGVASVLLGAVNLRLGLVYNFKVMGGVNLLRFTGTFQDPNVFAASLISTLPLGIYIIKRSKRWAFRIAATIGLILIAIGAFTTFSRAAIFPFVFIVLAVLVKETRHSKFAFTVSVICSVTVMLILTPGFYWKRLFSLGGLFESGELDLSLLLRLKALKVAWGLFLAHPLTGIGLRNFIVRSGSDLYARMVVHNLYLEILVSVGIFGFVALLLIYSSGIRASIKGMRARWSKEGKWVGDLNFYLLISLASSLIAGFFLSQPFSYSIWIPLAACLAAGNISKDRI
jgi:putative inorganic carbon (HCO3(-)) transporter